ncbi:ATP-binding protein [Streptomyces sp. NWU339]|uniref:ATP-binding protein n=1 Tax=Streptomyces sp. NWU339 TaxID=2185284 RepID=UPI000D67B650|nr:ATP-binding protein [Streptomyces sp. NWU339]PWI09087.1 ATP-binding protein [Streptomyces sp. NWU339]
MHDVGHRLDSWRHPYASDVNETTALVTTALCADAVRPGRVPGRDFHIRPAAGADGGRLRVEASDTRVERRPAVTAPCPAPSSATSHLEVVHAASGPLPVHGPSLRLGPLPKPSQ